MKKHEAGYSFPAISTQMIISNNHHYKLDMEKLEKQQPLLHLKHTGEQIMRNNYVFYFYHIIQKDIVLWYI